jgi:hypothetical protein
MKFDLAITFTIDVFFHFFQFVDDDGKVYLEMSYYFEIRKDWPTFQ